MLQISASKEGGGHQVLRAPGLQQDLVLTIEVLSHIKIQWPDKIDYCRPGPNLLKKKKKCFHEIYTGDDRNKNVWIEKNIKLLANIFQNSTWYNVWLVGYWLCKRDIRTNKKNRKGKREIRDWFRNSYCSRKGIFQCN